MSGYDKPVTRAPRKESITVSALDGFKFDPFESAAFPAKLTPDVPSNPTPGTYVLTENEPSRGAQVTQVSKGTKLDQGKEPLDLLSRTWLLDVARVMGFGAKKYASHNWRKGIERSRLGAAALRHLLAYMDGEDLDPETGLSHLSHASCCLMFMRETHETHPELDDRYKGKK